MSVPAINITPDPWRDRLNSFPIGLPQACIWLAIAYTVPQYLREVLVAQGVSFPAGWPDKSVQLAIRTLLTVLFFVYFLAFRRGSVVDLGLSTRRIGGDVVWGIAASIVMGVLYLAGMFLVYLGVLWWTGSAVVFWETMRRLPIGDPSLGHVLAVALVYPVLEEFWFRALMYPPMRLVLGRVWAILFLSMIFGAAHEWPPVTQFVGGLVFAYAYEKRQTIYASIILHIAGNGILFVIGWAMRDGLIRI